MNGYIVLDNDSFPITLNNGEFGTYVQLRLGGKDDDGEHFVDVENWFIQYPQFQSALFAGHEVVL